MYRNTERLFDRVAAFQKVSGEIMAEYDAAEQNAARFKGSDYYTETMRAAKQKRDTDLLTEKKSTVAAVRKIAEDMRQTARGRKFVPPSPEMVYTLQLLQMRDKISREEAEQIERAFAGCPVALSTLDEVCAAHNVHLTGAREPSVGAVISKVNSLEQCIYRVLNDPKSSLYGRIPTDETSFLADFASFGYGIGPDGKAQPNQRDISTFSDAVNGPDN